MLSHPLIRVVGSFLMGLSIATLLQHHSSSPTVSLTSNNLTVGAHELQQLAWSAPGASGLAAGFEGGTSSPSLESLESVWSGRDLVKGKMTVIIPSLDRETHLVGAVPYLRKMPDSLIDTIAVQWVPGDDAPIPEWLQEEADNIDHPIRVIVESMPDRSLNQRFRPFGWIRTQAVLSLDDDIYITEEDLTRLMKAFDLLATKGERIVGSTARHYWTDGTAYAYRLDAQDEYSMILTNVALVHRAHLALYWQHAYAELRDFVDQQRNCEDILMNFIVSSWTRLPPMLVRPKCVFMQPSSNGISSHGGHLEKRNQCIRRFKETMGGDMPLISTRQVIAHFEKTDTNPGAHCGN